jgi:murein DD-endopeptidase MepM/ murein hydrolase activator NlpD
MADGRHLSVIIVPDGAGEESRTFRIPYGRLKALGIAVGAAGLVLAVMVGSWWYLAARSVRASELEEEVAQLQAEQARVAILAARLAELEERYLVLRSLFGTDSLGTGAESLLPMPTAGQGENVDGGELDPESRLPTSWPLTEGGFITRVLLEGDGGEHPGLDIAIPNGSYIRAAGAGEVVDVGEDEVYGRYVVLDHGNGYRTRYAHASLTLVERDETVRRNEVIALSGSTGQSTAPHLHFEIMLDGEPVDPLTMVQRP